MKIIEEPSKRPWSAVFVCQQCATRLEIEIGDFKRHVSDQRDGNAAVYECPTCGRENWVDTALIPRHLHHRLPPCC